MSLARFFGTICIISKVTTAPATLEEKTRLQEVLNTEEKNGHKKAEEQDLTLRVSARYSIYASLLQNGEAGNTSKPFK